MNPDDERELDRASTSSRALAWIRPNSFSTVIRYKPASCNFNSFSYSFLSLSIQFLFNLDRELLQVGYYEVVIVD